MSFSKYPESMIVKHPVAGKIPNDERSPSSGTEPRDSAPSSFRSLLLYVTSGIAPVPIALHLRQSLLTEKGGGYETVAQFTGRSSADSLSVFEQLALYREDLLFLFVIAPALFLLVLKHLTPRLRLAFSLAFSTCTSLVLYIQLKCYWEVGTFLPASVLATGLTAVGRDFLPSYLNTRSMTFFSILLCLSYTSTFACGFSDSRGTLRRDYDRIRHIFDPVLLLLLLLTTSSWLVPLSPSPYSFSSTIAALRAFVSPASPGSAAEGLPAAETPAELIDAYRRLTFAPAPSQSEFFGAANGYDVLFFVMETAPQDCFAELPESFYPTFKELERASFIGRSHYSTYPYTVRAIFSIYSSWYPSNGFQDSIKELDAKHAHLQAPGVVQLLRAHKYRTAIFVPEDVDNWEHDRTRYNALGFNEIYYPEGDSRFRAPLSDQLNKREKLLQRDLETLQVLKEQLKQTLSRGERYVFSFHPQFGHGPWPGVSETSRWAETVEAGKPVFSRQDAWLGEIVQILREHRRLEKTLIVITGDHAIRTRTEHPNFTGGTIDDISFHVPLQIFAPGIISDGPRHIEHLTSHIDIAPSILDLLGFKEGRDTELGSYAWNPEIKRRATFFFARNYLGTDGFHQEGSLRMLKYIIRSSFEAPYEGSLRFRKEDLRPFESAESAKTIDTLKRMTAIQSALAKTMVAP